jgi:general secretion pathway protein M
MRELPTGPRGHALAVAIAVLGAVIFYLVIVSPVLGYYNEQALIVQQRMDMAERFRTLAHELPSLRTTDKKWRDQFGGEILLTGQSDADASATIQSMMKQTVEDAGSKLTTSEILPEKTEGDFRRVGIRIAFSGDLRLISSVLKSMAVSHPVLFSGDFDLHAGTDQDDSTAVAGADILTMTLDVYGFRAG